MTTTWKRDRQNQPASISKWETRIHGTSIHCQGSGSHFSQPSVVTEPTCCKGRASMILKHCARDRRRYMLQKQQRALIVAANKSPYNHHTAGLAKESCWYSHHRGVSPFSVSVESTSLMHAPPWTNQRNKCLHAIPGHSQHIRITRP